MANKMYVTSDKVIFLDIDGVLNDEGKNLKHGVYIDEEMTARLKKIVEATGAQIVLSSSWRYYYCKYRENPDSVQGSDRVGLDMLNDLFEKYELKISDCTERLSSGPYARPLEIRTWLATEQDIKSFVILDDDDFWVWNWLSDRFVMTKKLDEHDNWIRGLDDEHVARAIDILNR